MTDAAVAARWRSRHRSTPRSGWRCSTTLSEQPLAPGTLVRVPLGRREVPGIVWQRRADGAPPAAGLRPLAAPCCRRCRRWPPMARADRLRRRLLPARRRRTGAGGAAARTAQARRHRGWRGAWRGCSASRPARRRCRPPRRRGAPALSAEQQRRSWRRSMAALAPRRRRSRCCCTASPAAARPRSTCTPPTPRWQQRPAGAGAGARDQPHAAARGALRRALPGPRAGQPAQRPDAGAAAAPLAAGAPGPGRPGAGHAAGGVRVDAAAGADRRRRGARPLVQAAGRRALLGARPGRLARAPAERVPVLLGSATPSLETWQRAAGGPLPAAGAGPRASAAARMPRGAAGRHGRAAARQRPARPRARAAAAGGDRASASARGEQSLLLLNRRGYAPVLHCGACGWKSGCPHCSAWRVFHKADRTLRCHHCGLTERVPRACPDCGNLDIAPIGRGTEKLRGAAGRAAARRAHRPHRRRHHARQGRARARSWPPCMPARSTCWWARRWWPRGTTSAASRWWRR